MGLTLQRGKNEEAIMEKRLPDLRPLMAVFLRWHALGRFGAGACNLNRGSFKVNGSKLQYSYAHDHLYHQWRLN